MLELIQRCPEYVDGYRQYCQEAFDHHVIYFLPTDPKRIDETWFSRTKNLYDQKETGQIKPISFQRICAKSLEGNGWIQSPPITPPKVIT